MMEVRCLTRSIAAPNKPLFGFEFVLKMVRVTVVMKGSVVRRESVHDAPHGFGAEPLSTPRGQCPPSWIVDRTDAWRNSVYSGLFCDKLPNGSSFEDMFTSPAEGCETHHQIVSYISALVTDMLAS